jgi:hypothetical protein
MVEYVPESDAARSRRLLIRLLEADLELAFTFLRTAAIHAWIDADHSQSELSKAKMVLESIRRFQERAKDPVVWKMFQDRVSELQAIIEAFEQST